MAKLGRFIVITILFTILGIAAGVVCWAVVRASSPKYTAETVIRVLPPPTMNPFELTSAQPSRDIQYAQRVSTAMLIKQQSTLEQLLSRDKIRETGWFSSHGGASDVRQRSALRDLKKNFDARPMRDGDFVILSMTCTSPREAAIIVNEMVDVFIAEQGGAAKKDIAERLARLNEQLVLLQRDLDAAEQSLDDVRRASGFADLEERNLPEAVAERFVRLDSMADELQLDIAEAQSWVNILTKRIGDPNSENTQLQQAKDELAAIKARAEELKQMRDATLKAKNGRDTARIQYDRRVAIRDERKMRVDEAKAAIERLRAVREDPQTPQLQFVARAPEPIEISSPKWELYIPIATMAGLLFGLVFATLGVVRGQSNKGDIAPL